MSIAHFEQEIGKVVDYFREEYSLKYGEAIGVLHSVAWRLIRESVEKSEEENGPQST